MEEKQYVRVLFPKIVDKKYAALINYFSISLSTKRDLIIVLHCALLVDIEHLFMFASHVGLFFLDIFFS